MRMAALCTGSNDLPKIKMTLFWTTALLATIFMANGIEASPYFAELRALASQQQQQAPPPEHQLTNVDLWRYILSMDARSKIFPGSYRRTVGTDQTRKRGGSSSCMFNAGLAHNCDYRDVVGAVNEMNHWGSDLAPGRRKKRDAGHQMDNGRDQDEFPVNLLRDLIERNRILSNARKERY